MTIQTALLQGRQILEKAGVDAPRLNAEVLLAHAVGCDRVWLYAHSDEELRELWWIHYGRYLHERIKGKPTQYITGLQEFYGRDFRVTRDVLIPRPETEHSIETALALRGSSRASTAVDIGTGSGAIGITLSLETQAEVICTDISEAALRVAQANARRLGSAARFIACDLGSALVSGAFDLVVSNPPYIPETDRDALPREVREYEPHLALFGGPDGLGVYRRLIPEAARLLLPGGHLVMEIGAQEAEKVSAILGAWPEAWTAIEIRPDLAGIPRVVIARRA